MNLSSIVLCLALAFVVMVCGVCQKPPGNYLDRRPGGKSDRPAYDWIKKQLQESTFSGPEEIRRYFEQTQEKLAAADEGWPANYGGSKIILNDVLYELVELANGSPNCTYNMVGYYINLVEYVFGSVEVLSRPKIPIDGSQLLDYLRHYGRIKFENCSNKLHEIYQELIADLDANVERKFDELVASQDTFKSAPVNDEYLTKLASKIDLNEEQFDAKKMLRVAKSYRGPESFRTASPATLSQFIANKCAKLLSPVKNWLNIYNINLLLSPLNNDGQHNFKKLLKLNEYGRICHYDPVKVEAYIAKKLSSKLALLAKEFVRKI